MNWSRSIPTFIRRLALATMALAFGVAIAIVWSVLRPKSEIEFVAAAGVTYLLVWGIFLLLSRQPVTETAVGFTLTSATLMAVLLALEATAAAGLVDFRALIGSPITHEIRRPINQPDPDLLWRRKPYLVLEGTRTTGNITYSQCLPASEPRPYRLAYDGNGFRNPHDLQHADIAVVGDSYIEGVDIMHDDLITTVLARKTGLTVANLGLSGYGPVQHLVTTKRYALPLRPRVLVWALYEWNDLEDLSDYARLREELDPGWRQVLDHSVAKVTINRLYHLYRGCAYLWRDPPKRYGHLEDPAGRMVTLYFHGPPRVLDETHLAALDELRAIAGQMQRVTRAAGVKTVVVFVPDKFRVYKDLLDYAPDSEARGWRLNDLSDRFKKIMREMAPDFSYLDLTPAFITEAKKRRILYLSDDTHWNEQGHHVAADAIRAHLAELDRSLLAGPRPSGRVSR